ncbi:carboxylating nicotinate-nucleotide diphosphorylase [Alteribacter populi]|uniref:carboxylating nicotinate-nucleotide diphosphorylase n=1 Tax=Alteribacter populi TaxID=2011011 RepID=UPI000BBA6C89|nr:carboxylating nicotinate-nucleotide diphosphorylase [Alteribacter populi]
MNKWMLKQSLEEWLREDIGFSDLTAEAIFPSDAQGEAKFIAKQPGVFFGVDILNTGYRELGLNVDVVCEKKDGDLVQKGDILANVSGSVRDILTTERVFLNLLQRLSGVATATKRAVEETNGFSTRICDTRKTTPGLRMLEKAAVRAGGGGNHRFRLDDAILIKDNHISACGSIHEAVKRVKASVGHMVKIEVEVETAEQVEEAVKSGADVIMFDNVSPDTAKEWVERVPSVVVTEVSGGIATDAIRDYAATGVDVISMGVLTHSVKALDISLAFVEKGGGVNERA